MTKSCAMAPRRGEGFLAQVVADWESATETAADAGVRVVNVRTGIVQSPRGGALHFLYPLFLAGLGGPVGHGDQWMSWIGLDDLLDIYLRALLDVQLVGPVNAVAPHPVRSRKYARALGRAAQARTAPCAGRRAAKLCSGRKVLANWRWPANGPCLTGWFRWATSTATLS